MFQTQTISIRGGRDWNLTFLVTPPTFDNGNSIVSIYMSLFEGKRQHSTLYFLLNENNGPIGSWISAATNQG